jgi:hypothetical protein
MVPPWRQAQQRDKPSSGTWVKRRPASAAGYAFFCQPEEYAAEVISLLDTSNVRPVQFAARRDSALWRPRAAAERGGSAMFSQNPSTRRTRNASLSLFDLMSRAIRALTALSALAAMHPMAAYGADLANRQPHAERRAASIVNGHRLQPSPADLSRPDMSAQSAGVVDELYRQLIKPRDGR